MRQEYKNINEMNGIMIQEQCFNSHPYKMKKGENEGENKKCEIFR